MKTYYFRIVDRSDKPITTTTIEANSFLEAYQAICKKYPAYKAYAINSSECRDCHA